MQPILNRWSRVLRVAAALFPLVAFASSARADIFQWEFINPADPSQGKQQSTTLVPGGAGVDAVPGADLANRNLHMAYLIGADLTNANAYASDLLYADLTQANLTNANFTNANFHIAMLTDADFTNAQVRGASLSRVTYNGFNASQLYSTASYEAHDLSGIDLTGNDLAGWNFAGQNLTNGNFGGATLTGANFRQANLTNTSFSTSSCDGMGCSTSYATLADADFTDADVRSADFNQDVGCDFFFCGPSSAGISLAQLYSTRSYKSHDLTGISLAGSNLTGANFAGQNLMNASFSAATLTDADFTGADVRGADFTQSTSCNLLFCFTPVGGITLAQLYSTASYQARDLSGIRLAYNNHVGANFSGQNLTNSSFSTAALTGADFSQANLTNADFYYATLTGANFNQANLTNADFSYAALTGADFTGAEVRGANIAFTLAQLYSTANYRTHDLTGIKLRGDLGGANFAGQNLTNAGFTSWYGSNSFQPGAMLWRASFRNSNLHNASFQGATLTDADFTGADIRGAYFGIFRWHNQPGGPYGTGISLAQLYSTANYQAGDLSWIAFGASDLTGGNFAGQNLTNSSFANHYYAQDIFYALLTGADFTGADTRGAGYLEYIDSSSTTTTNLIWPDGHIDDLDLEAGGLLVVRDYDGRPEYGTIYPPIPITVFDHLAVGPGGTLRMVFEADAWDSTISFAPGIPVALGGTLELTFADSVNLASQVGRTFDLFNWADVNPIGTFAVSSPYAWDLSNLYTTGEVTLTAVPEPSTMVQLMFSAAGCRVRRRRGKVQILMGAYHC